MRNNQQMPSTTNQCKKPYHKPQLQVYGSLKDITRTVILGNGAQDGIVVLNKTH
jgi:hypothetical protein